MLNYLILAVHHTEEPGSGGKGMSVSVGLVLLALVIGLAVTLMPPKRTYEVKKQKEE